MLWSEARALELMDTCFVDLCVESQVQMYSGGRSVCPKAH
jgi:hypothetical protein